MTLLDAEILCCIRRLGKFAHYGAVQTALELQENRGFHKQNLRRSMDQLANWGYISIHACRFLTAGRPATRRFEITSSGTQLLDQFAEHLHSFLKRLES